MISVIIPAYNSSRTLARTLASVSVQSIPDIEIIVVDDGSTDETAHVALDIAKREPRLRVVSTPNQGAYKARLHGVSMAEGEWIAFCDSDDTMPPEALASLLSETDKTHDIVVGTINLNNKGIFQHQVSGSLSPDKYISALLESKTSIGPCAKLYRRSLFNLENLDIDKTIHQNEDLLMLVKLADSADKIKIMPQLVVYDYIFRHDGASRQRFPLSEWFALFTMLAETLKSRPHLTGSLTTFKIRSLYNEGVLKVNDFSGHEHELSAISDEAARITISGADKIMLRTILSPIRRKVTGIRHMTLINVKRLVKKLIAREE